MEHRQFSLSLPCYCTWFNMEEQKEEEQFKRVSELVTTASSVLLHFHSINNIVCSKDSRHWRIWLLQPVSRFPERSGRWMQAKSSSRPNDSRLCELFMKMENNTVVHSLKYRHLEGQSIHPKQAELWCHRKSVWYCVWKAGRGDRYEEGSLGRYWRRACWNITLWSREGKSRKRWSAVLRKPRMRSSTSSPWRSRNFLSLIRWIIRTRRSSPVSRPSSMPKSNGTLRVWIRGKDNT